MINKYDLDFIVLILIKKGVLQIIFLSIGHLTNRLALLTVYS